MKSNSIQFHSVQSNSIHFYPTQFNSIHFNSIQYNLIQLKSIQDGSCDCTRSQKNHEKDDEAATALSKVIEIEKDKVHQEQVIRVSDNIVMHSFIHPCVCVFVIVCVCMCV